MILLYCRTECINQLLEHLPQNNKGVKKSEFFKYKKFEKFFKLFKKVTKKIPWHKYFAVIAEKWLPKVSKSKLIYSNQIFAFNN